MKQCNKVDLVYTCVHRYFIYNSNGNILKSTRKAGITTHVLHKKWYICVRSLILAMHCLRTAIAIRKLPASENYEDIMAWLWMGIGSANRKLLLDIRNGISSKYFARCSFVINLSNSYLICFHIRQAYGRRSPFAS